MMLHTRVGGFMSPVGGGGVVSITMGTRTLYNPSLDISPQSIPITLDEGADFLLVKLALLDSVSDFASVRETDASGTLFTAIGTQVTQDNTKVHMFGLVNPTASTIWVQLDADGRLGAVIVPLFGVDPDNPIADVEVGVQAGGTSISTAELTPVGAGGWLELIISKVNDGEAGAPINCDEQHDVGAGPFRLLSGSASEVNAAVTPGFSWAGTRVAAAKAVILKAAAHE
jgi:hypothetical protein